jgi:hypothetical protein
MVRASGTVMPLRRFLAPRAGSDASCNGPVPHFAAPDRLTVARETLAGVQMDQPSAAHRGSAGGST